MKQPWAHCRRRGRWLTGWSEGGQILVFGASISAVEIQIGAVDDSSLAHECGVQGSEPCCIRGIE